MNRTTRNAVTYLIVASLMAGHVLVSAARSEGTVSQVFYRESAQKPNPYGPFCTTVDGNVTHTSRQRAYEPFEQLEQRRAKGQRSGSTRYSPDRVLVKLAPTRTSGLKLMSTEFTSDLSGVEGIESLVRIFPIPEALSGPRLYSSVPNEVHDDKPDLTRWYRAQIKKGHTVEKVMADLQDNPSVEIAEPDYVFELVGQIPDNTTDPNIAQQWHMDTIRARQAWEYLESLGLPPGGSRDIVVAVIDSGVDYTHPDLAANMWVNRQEIADNSEDDDWNGFVDDIHGVSVLGDDRDHSGDPMDLNGHGTHVAGIIAAVADNGIGGVGVAYNTRIMAIKAAQYNGTFYASDIAEAVYYAIENGADVINMSLSSGAHSKVIEDALGVAFGHAVLVAAAGNDGAHNEEPPKLPKPKPGFPASYIYCLGVMAQRPSPDTKGQHLADFSNWDNHPDSRIEYEVMAPGVDIFSTLPGDNYAAWDGTSIEYQQ